MRTRRVLVLSCLAAAAVAQPGPTLDKEKALGNGLATEFRSRTRAIESPEALEYINRIGQRLAAEISGPPFTYTFGLFADDPARPDEIVAFPAGFLFVPKSLVLAARDEDELAGLLAHVIAHVASRHGTRQSTRDAMAQTASIPLIYIGGWAGLGAQAQMPSGMAQMAREFELDADRLAARTMAAAGYDPAAFARYIERVAAADDGARPRAFSGSPDRAQRLEAIRERIAELPARTYDAHEGLAKIQEEIRRASPPSPAPTSRRAPTLLR